MKKNYGFLFLALAFGMSFSIGALAQENSGSSQSTITSEGRSPDRFLRRVIFEGALANAGYQGDNTDRYSKPNGYSAGAVVDLLGSQNLVLETGDRKSVV